MNRRELITLLAPGVLLAQTEKFPSRRFKYGEVLNGPGYTVTLHEEGFEVHSTDKEVDHVEIVVGRERKLTYDQFPDKPIRVLRFETFTSSIFVDIHVAVGQLPYIDTVRTIRIVMLKVKNEEMFR